MTATRALLVIDVQNDFCEGGSLAVAGGTAVAAGITELLRTSKERYALTVATRDFHDPTSTNGGHFAAPGEQPDYDTTWPAHCIQGTPGADYSPALDTSLIDVHVIKGMGKPAYSGFQGVNADVLKRGSLIDTLRGYGITDLDIVGIATDYCVKATVLDALAAGAFVTVLTDLVAAVAPDTTGKAAIQQMGAAGATFATRRTLTAA